MIAQTLSNRILDRALLPNGPIIQLGTFEDILSEQTNLRTLVVGFELEMEKEQPKALADTRVRHAEVRSASGLSTGIKSVKIISQFRSASDNGTSTSAIEASKVSVEHVSLEVSVLRRPLLDNQLPFLTEHEATTSLDFCLDIKRLSSEELEKGTEALEAMTNNIYAENIEGAVDQTTQFFTSKIRYLGPLRADPQTVQKFAPVAN